MKKVLLFLWLSWGMVELLATPDSLFKAANGSYQAGNYEMALTTYREILGEGFESADLYYNMGNAAYRANDIGHSILYYEKALKLDPSHDDARNNLAFVSRYRVDTFDEVPELFFRSWARALVNSLSERIWSLLSILLFVLILTGLLVYLFSNRLGFKKSGFFTSLIGVLFFTVTFSSALTHHRNIVNPEGAVITSPSVIVRSSPSETGTELFVLHEGTKVKVNEEVAGWRNIRVIDGREGWITSGDFESI